MGCRSIEKANTAKAEIEATSIKGTLSTLELDVTDETSVENAVSYIKQQFGQLNVLINNAGSGSMDPNVKTRFKSCLETNVMGPAMMAAAFRPLLLESTNAYSIYIGSGERTLIRNAVQQPPSTHNNIRNGDAYQTSKSALNMIAVLEARDYGPQGLKVFVISPGFVRSNLRGTSEEARSGWGQAGDPLVSGELILSVVQGKRDADVGCLIHKDGVFPW
jgi:NAD(P)-dependent dehydrogenase (short-subunit alcohol dehydrogenase family)